MSVIKVKTVRTPKQWSELNKRVFQVIKEKKIAYKHEIELFLELEGYQNYDVGRSLAYLSKYAPVVHLDTITTKIDGNNTKFFYRKKEKSAIVRRILAEKKKLLNRYYEIADGSGKWAHITFYPKLFNKAGFIVLAKNATYFNEVIVNGDLDLILDTIEPSSSKIFVDIKNSLKPYRNQQLHEFFEKLTEFNLNIIPIVIAKQIYQGPKGILKNFNGNQVEIGKVLVPMEFSDNSKEFNKHIAEITRVIPDRLLPKDIILKFNKIQKLNEGFNFNKINLDTIFKNKTP